MRLFLKIIHPTCLMIGHDFHRLNRDTLYCTVCGKTIKG